MDITLQEKQEILSHVMERYFGNTHIERIVLGYLGENSIDGKVTSTKNIGKWHVDYEDQGLEHYAMTARLWPFRRSEREPVSISGRFVLYSEERNRYQEGQIELEYRSPRSLQPEDFAMMFVSYKGSESPPG